MKILFTGTSSFTGFWFIQELSKRAHSIHAVCRKNKSDYSEIRKQRIEKLSSVCNLHFGCEFGSESFIQLIESQGSIDLFCHHAAEVSNYKSSDFDWRQALDNNVKNLRSVLKRLKAKSCPRVILTGSIFESNEGGSSKTVSPYGLSKTLTYEVFRYHCEEIGMNLGKFVIPNPFGPFEEFRFTSYLVQSWKRGEVPVVLTPAYVRDNIHVDLLAREYALFAERSDSRFSRPSGYVETQGDFTKRFAEEMRKRLSLPCLFELKEQTDFPEPMKMANPTPCHEEWDEKRAWDSLANYYSILYME